MRLAVIGAGAIGCAVARAAARHDGVEVTLFDRNRPGAGTTGTTLGWINAHNKEPRAYFELNRAGLRAHAELQRNEPTSQRWYFPHGNLEWAVSGGHVQDLHETVTRLRERGYPAEWIDRRRAAAIAPDAVVGDDVEAIAWFPEEGFVVPALLLARLLGEARDRGAIVRTGQAVQRVDTTSAGAVVRVAGGPAERFDAVVSCAGRWTGPLLAGSGVVVPMADPGAAGSPAVGYLGYTDPVPSRLSCLLTTPALNVRPEGGGRLVVQGLDLDASADPAREPSAAVRDELRARLRTLLRGAEHAEVAEVRVGQRALPADGHTVAGFVDTAARHYTIATHSGMTLCLHLADLAIAEVLAGREQAELAGFRPQRFTAGTADPNRLVAARRPGQQ
ncbi:FAD-dependent oxidoreductase [Amycolatopsis dongchuanensis]|uniref:FAD-binding oxidoreductase n=1 Tax=Amycolatopsis dongchuanensis TaxID=1070866 RepID=A0ABP8VPY7_9PSEU